MIFRFSNYLVNKILVFVASLINILYFFVPIENINILNYFPLYVTSDCYNIAVNIFEYTLPQFLSPREVELSFSVIPSITRLSNLLIPKTNYYCKYKLLLLP